MKHAFLRFVVRRLPIGPHARVRKSLKDPIGTQRRVLRTLLKRSATTEWGRDHGYADLLTLPDSELVRGYQEATPLQRYATLEPAMRRMMAGEADVLVPGKTKFCALSGGTYSAGKFIPSAPEMLQAVLDAGVAMGFEYVNRTGNVDAGLGKILPLAGRVWPHADNPDLLCGNLSGVLTRYQLDREGGKAPFWLGMPLELLEERDWESKLAKMAEATVDLDIRYMVLIPSWGLTLFRLVIEAYNRRHNANATTLVEVWPKLRVIATAGVPLAPYRERMRAVIGSDQVSIIDHYGAADGGFMAYQTDLDDPAMLLMLDSGIFFEYVPVEEQGTESPRRLTIDQVEPGVDYVPYVTNLNGLWAYELGDVVRFTQTDPPKIVVVRRLAEMLTAQREHVFGQHVLQAVQAAERATRSRIGEYHVTYCRPAEGVMPRHHWLVEFDSPPGDLEGFARLLDEGVAELSPSYSEMRSRRGLLEPELTPLPLGALAEGLARTGRELDMQTKVPRLSESLAISEAVLETLAKS